MKPNNVLMLTLAMSTALWVTACNRDRTETPAAADTTTAATPVVDEPMPAPTPAEPAAPAPMSATPTDSGMSFAEMDKNKDGGISHDEIADSEMLHQHFDAADTDKNGKLSQEEVDKHRADMAAKPGG